MASTSLRQLLAALTVSRPRSHLFPHSPLVRLGHRPVPYAGRGEWGGLRGEGKDTRKHSTRSYRHSPKDRMFTRVFPAVSVPRLLGALFVPPSLLGSSSHETA